MRKFSEMSIGEDVIFSALVENLQKRFTPNKKAYYSLGLTDGDTIIDARVWDEGLVEKNEVNAGEVYTFEYAFQIGDGNHYQFMFCANGLWEFSVDNILIEKVTEAEARTINGVQ